MAKNCVQCGRFVGSVEGAKCQKCTSLFHRECAKLSPTGSIPKKWVCLPCNKNKSNPGLSKVPPVASPVDRAVVNASAVEDTAMDMVVELRLLRSEIVSFRTEMAQLTNTLTEFKNRIEGLESRLTCLEEQPREASGGDFEGVISQLQAQLNERDQDLLLNDVEISGLPELPVQCITKTSVTRISGLSQKERIQILRQKVQEEILSKSNPGFIHPFDVEDSSYEDERMDSLPITPILVNYNRKTESFKTALTTVKFDVKNGGKAIDNFQRGGVLRNVSVNRLRSKKRVKRIRIKNKKPLEIFYRRIFDYEIVYRHPEWVHCQDIITPFLTGAKLNISNPKVLNTKDPTVLRLLSLLKVDTSAYSRDDIYSILYQISNLNLRFFRWDVSSMKMLFNIIIKEKSHTFGSLKKGLRDLFNRWRLDFSNSTALLRQARIFRPPCVIVAASGDGSTKLPKQTKYPKRKEPTTPCEDYDDDCKD